MYNVVPPADAWVSFDKYIMYSCIINKYIIVSWALLPFDLVDLLVEVHNIALTCPKASMRSADD